MKVELIKITDVTDSVVYKIEKNGVYVSNSIALNIEEAKRYYENVVSGRLPKEEIIEQFIDDTYEHN
jgi:hypothetical protein